MLAHSNRNLRPWGRRGGGRLFATAAVPIIGVAMPEKARNVRASLRGGIDALRPLGEAPGYTGCGPPGAPSPPVRRTLPGGRFGCAFRIPAARSPSPCPPGRRPGGAAGGIQRPGMKRGGGIRPYAAGVAGGGGEGVPPPGVLGGAGFPALCVNPDGARGSAAVVGRGYPPGVALAPSGAILRPLPSPFRPRALAAPRAPLRAGRGFLRRDCSPSRAVVGRYPTARRQWGRFGLCAGWFQSGRLIPFLYFILLLIRDWIKSESSLVPV